MSRRVSDIKFNTCRDETGKNMGYTALHPNGMKIALVAYSSSGTGFVSEIIGEKENRWTKTRLEIEIYLAKKYNLPIDSTDQETLDLLKKLAEN